MQTQHLKMRAVVPNVPVGTTTYARALEIRQLLQGENVFKLDIGSSNVPHPGNPKIFYRKFDLEIVNYDFSDC